MKKIRCDNADENISLEELCSTEGLGIDFEHTARNTPQHNGRIQRTFQTLFGRVKAMLNHAGIPSGIRQGTWPEAAFTAMLWHNVIVQKEGDKPPHTLFWGGP